MSNMFAKPELDARLKGLLFKDIPTGISQVEYIFEYDCSFNGAAIASSVTKLSTSIKLETQYTIGDDIWLRYKKFGDSWNLYPNYICKNILFPTQVKAGIKLIITIDNKEGSLIDLGINLFTFIPSEEVKPELGQQGEDW